MNKSLVLDEADLSIFVELTALDTGDGKHHYAHYPLSPAACESYNEMVLLLRYGTGRSDRTSSAARGGFGCHYDAVGGDKLENFFMLIQRDVNIDCPFDYRARRLCTLWLTKAQQGGIDPTRRQYVYREGWP